MDAAILKPDYAGGSIVNLMSSLIAARGGEPTYAPARELDHAALAQARNVVLLVVDGLGYNYLTARGAGGHLHQHLRARLTSVFPTTTASAITTFLSGVAPQQHGLTGWFMHLKEIGTVTAILPFQPRFGALALQTAKIHASDLFHIRSVFERVATPSYVITQARIVESEFSLATTRRAQRRAYENLDEYFALITRTAREGGRKYIYAYWPEFDSLCHTHGVASPQVAAHFAQLDASFGALIEQLRGTDSVVIVCADHGLIDTTPARTLKLDQHPEVADALTLPLCGEPRVAYCYVRAARAREFAQYIGAEMSTYCDLYVAEQAVAEGLFGTGTPHPRLLDRIGDFVLLMKSNYVIKDLLRNERPFSQVGVHGGLTADELYVPLVVAAV
jgi:hypothetical protein